MRKIIITLAILTWALLAVSVAGGHPLQNYIEAQPGETGPFTLNSGLCSDSRFDGNFIYTDYMWVGTRTPDFKGGNSIHRNYKFTLTKPMRVTAHTFGSDVMNVTLHLLKHIGNDQYELMYYSYGMHYEAQDKGWPSDYEFYAIDFVGMTNIPNLYRKGDHGYLHEVLPPGEYVVVAEGVARKMQTDVGRLNVTIRGVDIAETPTPWGCMGQDPYLGLGLGDIKPKQRAQGTTGLDDLWRVSGGEGVDAHFYLRVTDEKQALSIIAFSDAAKINSISVYRNLGNCWNSLAGYGDDVNYYPLELPPLKPGMQIKETTGLDPGVYLIVVNATPEAPGTQLNINIQSQEPKPEIDYSSSGADFEHAINLGVFDTDFAPIAAPITADRLVAGDNGRKCIYHQFELNNPMNVEIDYLRSDFSECDVELYRYYDIHGLYPEKYFLLKEEQGLPEARRAKVKTNLGAGKYFIRSLVRANETKVLKIQVRGSVDDFEKTALRPNSNRAYIISSKPVRDLPNADWANVSGESVVTVQYYDGLGRPDQTVVQAISPKGNDLVSHSEYDQVGRLSKSWLPVARTRGLSGAYVDRATLSAFAGDLYGQRAYSGIDYGTSNFDQVSSQYKPGDFWTYKKQTFGYRFNQAAGELSCIRFDITVPKNILTVNPGNLIIIDKQPHKPFEKTDLISIRTLKSNGFYPTGTLYVDESSDEDGRRTLTFTDFYGRTLLVRQVLESGEYADTYSVYDDYGNLCYVLSPMGSAAAASGDMDKALADYAFIYRYDNKHRCIETKKPGAQSVRYIYDRKGQQILSQDGNQAPANQWTYTIPDKLGRPVLEGVCELTGVTQSLLSDSVIVATFDPSLPTNGLYRHNAPFTVNQSTIQRANYYDSYACQKQLPMYFTAELQYDVNEIGKPYTNGLDHNLNPVGNTPRPHFGQLTGTVTAVVGHPVQKLASAHYYNYEQRVVQSKSTTLVGGVATTDTRYDFSGNVLTSRERSFMPGAAEPDELLKRAVYNHSGAPVFQQSTLNGSTPVEVRYAYDELNRLAAKTYGKGADTLSETYRYNIQSWLTHQNSRLYEAELKYENPGLPSTDGGASVVPSYTGNITQWNWRHIDPANTGLPQNSYGFNYDALNRVTDSHHYARQNTSSAWTLPAVPMSERSLQYDLNGNIRSLTRNASGAGSPLTAVADRLVYEYQGNTLTALDHNNLSGSAEAAGRYGYSYDANGNMVKDLRKGLDFDYNYLNLVSRVSDAHTRAEYTWLADGTKLAVADNDGQGYLYSGSLIYQQQSGGAWKLESADFNSGRIIVSEMSFAGAPRPVYIPHYQLADHLGSVRTVFTLSGNGPQIVAQNDYYPFGMRHANSLLAHGTDTDNRFLFNGKENQVSGRLGLLDYGARMYDPLTTRWFGLDPLAEKYYPVSPYAYCAGNPVKFTDDNGESLKDAIVGLIVGVATNISGDNSLRNAYAPDNAQHYNNALQAADVGSMAIGGAQIIAGSAEILGGIGVGAGGTLVTAGTGAPVAIPAGAAISGTGVLTVGTGVMLMSNASKNLGGKYEYGAQQDNQGKKSNPKKEAREAGKEKRDNQKASEGYAKYKAGKLEKTDGKGARRDAHDAKDKIGRDRTKKELDEDYKSRK